MTPAIDVLNVSKVYRRYARKRQFATLKSAILDGSLLGDLNPDETFQALKGVSFSVPKGCTYGVIGRNGSGKSTLPQVRRRHHASDRRARSPVDGRISALIELGAGFHPEISGPREHLHQRHHAGSHQERRFSAASTRSSSSRRCRIHRRAGQDVFVGHVHAPRLRRSRCTSIPKCCSSMKCWPSAIRALRTSAWTSSRSSGGATSQSCS
jgi:hypothetical protein